MEKNMNPYPLGIDDNLNDKKNYTIVLRLERDTRIELVPHPWEGCILPLY